MTNINSSDTLKDFESMNMETLVDEFEKLIKLKKVQDLKTIVEFIKEIFETRFNKLLVEKKNVFLEEGGNPIDFNFFYPLKKRFDKLLFDYKKKLSKYYSGLEKQFKENLNKRIEVIDLLKELIEKADTKIMYRDFKELQNNWENIGPIPRTKYNNTWRNYHHHVGRFYDLLHLNKDLRELDFKHNLEKKIKIVERAETLYEIEDVVKASEELQELHRIWKEDIGPVSKEYRESVWQRFSNATKKLHNKINQYLKENNKLKLEIISVLGSYDTSKNKTFSDWQKSIKMFEAKREEFFAIGKVSRIDNKKIWNKLKIVTKKFNSEKNKFYKNMNSVQKENLQKKQDLINLAKSLKDTDDFANTTDKMKKIQSDWKEIGHVPIKFSDKIWKEFKNTCDYYFDRFRETQNKETNDETESLNAKKEFLSQIKNVAEDEEITLEKVKEYIKTWKDMGKVPSKEKAIENDFNNSIDKLFEQLSINKYDALMLKYKISLNKDVYSNNSHKIYTETKFVKKKIEELTKEIRQLENNTSFISNAKKENPLVKKVKNYIETKNKELCVWEQKLLHLKSFN